MSEGDETLTTWRALLTEELAKHGETWGDLKRIAIDEGELDREIDPSFGPGGIGAPFTAWTARRVYFPAVYDGSQWVDSATRRLSKERTRHIGGGI